MINSTKTKILSILTVFCFMSIGILNAQCVASFTSTDNGNGNFSFASTMSNGAGGNTYSWDFGDGNSSTAANPSNNYSASGTYITSLTITDSSACSSSYTDTLMVTISNCNAAFTYIDNGVGSISFTSTSVGGASYSWDFGDGNTSTTTNPSNIFASSGAYSVCLIIEDTTIACIDTICQSITVSLCNLSVSISTTDNGNGNYSFTPNVTNGTAPYLYSWDFGDGNISTVANPSNTYASNGVYPLVLTVTDNDSCTAFGYDSLTFSSNCNAAFNYADNGGGNLSFTSTSIGGSSYSWDFGDGNSSTVANPSNIYASPGAYNVCLIIADSSISCSDTICQSVNVSLCNLSANYTYVDNGGGNYSFTSTVNNGTPAYTYLWDFLHDADTSNMSTVANPTFTYPSSGTYISDLVVTDANNCEIVFSDTIIVDIPSSCSSSYTYTDNGNGNYSFTNTSTGNPTSFHWNFGDGTTSTLANPSHTYLANGIFVAQLYATDTSGTCSDYYTMTFQVSGVSSPVACNAAFVILPDSAIANSVIVYNTSTGSNLTYFWSFGDGNTSTLASPNYIYSTDGPFELCLTIDNGDSCTSTYCDSISAGGSIFKQAGFGIAVTTPVLTEINSYTQLISAVSIYPNPTKRDLTIEVNLEESAQVEVYITDLLGNIISQISNEKLNIGSTRIHWNSAGISTGIYLVNVKTNNTLQVKKIVLNK